MEGKKTAQKKRCPTYKNSVKRGDSDSAMTRKETFLTATMTEGSQGGCRGRGVVR